MHRQPAHEDPLATVIATQGPSIENKPLPPPAAKDPQHNEEPQRARQVSTSDIPQADGKVLSRTRGALLLGIAMVARGEIALIVAQLARPLLLGSGTGDEGSSIVDEEPAAIVMWAILITTFAGAVGVGILLKAWQGRDDNRVTRISNPTQG